MPKYEIKLRGTLVVDEQDNGKVDPTLIFEAAFDNTMREMLKLKELQDPSVSGALASGEIVLAATVIAKLAGEALGIADVAMRTALHAAGVGTRDWDNVPPSVRLECVKYATEELVDA